MSTRMMTVAAMFLGTAMLAGCGERSGVRAASQAEAPVATAAPTAPAPAPIAVTPAPAPAACPTPAPRAPEKTETRKPSLGGDDLLSIRRLVLAQGVRNREPVDAGSSFKSEGGKIYAYMEVENRGPAPGEIVVEFEPPGGGAPHGDVTLAVGQSTRWRTWAYTRTAKTPGSWTAVVKNRKGDVLARAPFEVTL